MGNTGVLKVTNDNHSYMYTTNWSFHIEHSINKAYGNNIPQRDLNIVEIGCFEGRGTNILRDKLCKTDACKIFCIDPWEDVYVKGESAYSDIDFYFNNQYIFENKPGKFSLFSFFVIDYYLLHA